MFSFDCAVIGAGLAGLNVALKLGRLGRRVLLVDRKASLSNGIHTTGIFVRRTLEDFSLPSDCLGPVIRDVSLYSPNLDRLDLESPLAEFRVGRMARLYSELVNQCRAAGVTTALDTTLESIVSQSGSNDAPAADRAADVDDAGAVHRGGRRSGVASCGTPQSQPQLGVDCRTGGRLPRHREERPAADALPARSGTGAGLHRLGGA